MVPSLKDWPERFQLEAALWRGGERLLAGLDEVGRGPLAGPVVAAAVILPSGLYIQGVDDSKRVAAPLRERLASRIRERAVTFGLGAASPREIDRLNILNATHLAMRRAVDRLVPAPEHVLVDGNSPAPLNCKQTAVVGGDGLVHCIACASILAKVLRDKLMRSLSVRYPAYGWSSNVGYATAEHELAMEEFGLTPHHRRSFGNKQLELDLGL